MVETSASAGPSASKSWPRRSDNLGSSKSMAARSPGTSRRRPDTSGRSKCSVAPDCRRMRAVRVTSPTRYLRGDGSASDQESVRAKRFTPVCRISSRARRSTSGEGDLSNSMARPRRQRAGSARGVTGAAARRAPRAPAEAARRTEVTTPLWENPRRRIGSRSEERLTPRRKPLWLGWLLLVLVASPAWAQKKKLALEDLTADPPLSGRLVSGTTWVPGADRFSFIVRKGSGEEAVSELVLEDAKTGARKTVIAAESLAIPEEPKPAEVAPGVEKQPPKTGETAPGSREPRKPRRVSLEGYRWSPDGRRILLSGDDDLWLYPVTGGRLERLTHDKDPEEFPSFSPAGRRVAFVRKNDLYVLD